MEYILILVNKIIYINYPPSIVSSVYGQENKYIEVSSFYQNNSAFDYCFYVNGVTNEDKIKALIYITQKTYT